MNAVMKLDLVSDACEPAEPSSTRALLNAVTVTSYGELVSSVYVCDGVESDVATSEDPSPHSIVNLLALPSAVMVSVTVKFRPPAVTSDEKSTERTNVLLLTLSSASLRASTASVTVDAPVMSVSSAPSCVLESEKSPSVTLCPCMLAEPASANDRLPEPSVLRKCPAVPSDVGNFNPLMDTVPEELPDSARSVLDCDVVISLSSITIC